MDNWSLDHKLGIALAVVGLLTFLLRGNRNWVFGYRSRRSLMSHRHFACANKVFGLGMMLLGVVMLFGVFFFEYSLSSFSTLVKVVFFAIYFGILSLIIEYRLRKNFDA